ncbi:MAG: ribosome hibernation promotion factor [Thermodesulfobacteriota bacterium]
MKVKVNVTTRHLNDRNKSNRLREYALKKFPRIERYMNVEHEPSEIKLILESEKFRNIAEIIVNDGSYKTTATVIEEDHLAAIDKVTDIVIKQLRRNLDKLTSTKRRSLRNSKIKSQNKHDEKLSNKISEQKLPLKPMSLAEARLQLDISKDKFVVFRNSENDEMNVLYRNKNSSLILIKP